MAIISIMSIFFIVIYYKCCRQTQNTSAEYTVYNYDYMRPHNQPHINTTTTIPSAPPESKVCGTVIYNSRCS